MTPRPTTSLEPAVNPRQHLRARLRAALRCAPRTKGRGLARAIAGLRRQIERLQGLERAADPRLVPLLTGVRQQFEQQLAVLVAVVNDARALTTRTEKVVAAEVHEPR